MVSSPDWQRIGGVWLVAAAVLTSACARRQEAPAVASAPAAAPSAAGPDASPVIEAVGAVEVFGQGIVRLGPAGDRVLMQTVEPAYVLLVRLDSNGAIVSGAASTHRYSPGTTWLTVPTFSGRQTSTAVVTPPPRCDEMVFSTRRTCRAPPSYVAANSPALRRGEALMLFLTAEPFAMGALGERLNAVGRRVPLNLLPAVVMSGRNDLWAAYLVRRR